MWGEVSAIEAATSYNRESLSKLKNHSKLPNIFILLSFFGSLCYHFKFHRFEIDYIDIFL